MNKKEFIESIKSEVEQDKDSTKHIFLCWVNAIDTYPKNKEAILEFFHKDFFPRWLSTASYDSFMNFFIVMTALEKSEYFNQIVFQSDSQPAKINDSNVEGSLQEFFILAMYYFEADPIWQLKDLFHKLISPKISWDRLLRGEIDEKVPDKDFLNNLVSIVFSYLFSETTMSLYTHPMRKVNVLRSRDYFKLISLGISIDPNKLMDRIAEGSFLLLDDQVWKKNITSFYTKKKLSASMKQRFKSDQERKHLTAHLNDIASNHSLMVLIMMR